MVFKIDRCIDCELCFEACRATNKAPDYGWRTMILERYDEKVLDQKRLLCPFFVIIVITLPASGLVLPGLQSKALIQALLRWFLIRE